MSDRPLDEYTNSELYELRGITVDMEKLRAINAILQRRDGARAAQLAKASEEAQDA